MNAWDAVGFRASGLVITAFLHERRRAAANRRGRKLAVSTRLNYGNATPS
jgi:hypothetical protein